MHPSEGGGAAAPMHRGPCSCEARCGVQRSFSNIIFLPRARQLFLPALRCTGK